MTVPSTPAVGPVADKVAPSLAPTDGRSAEAKPATTPTVGAPGPAPAVQKPAWTAASGRDAFGPWADLRVGDVVQRLRWMPAASFRVGSTPDEPNYFGPERLAQATITRGFWIADSECTQALWRAVMGNNPSAHTGDDQLPVEQVTLYAAIDFTKALGKRFPSLRARLPSRDEWEYACRAGTTTWWWCGNDPNALRSVANIKETGGDDRFWKSSPVRSLRPNPWGLYDVHGNVAEWCLGNNTDRPARPIDAEIDQEDHINHRGLIRGGSFTSEDHLARSGALPYVGPEAVNIDIGFRFIITDGG